MRSEALRAALARATTRTRLAYAVLLLQREDSMVAARCAGRRSSPFYVPLQQQRCRTHR
jgi:hypothetical protein